LTQLARGSTPLRGEYPTAAVARADEPPAVELSTPAIHLPGELIPEEHDASDHERAAAGPEIRFRDHNHDKSQQSKTVIPATESEIRRKTACKSL